MTECCEGLTAYFPGECLSKKSVAEENGRKLRLRNSSSYCLLRVDGCWIDTSESEKCDFIMFCCDTKRAFVTEIKGKNIAKAYAQIEATCRSLPSQVRRDYALTGCIVSSRTPKLDTRIARAKDRLRREYGIDVVQKNRQIEVG